MTKVLFLGTPDFVRPVKKALEENFELVSNIEIADLIVVASYGKILKSKELNTPKYGAINIHPSALPKYRGSSPIQTQILDNVKESAITFIKMDEEVDHGDIIEQIPFEIKDSDTFESAVKRAFQLASMHLPNLVSNYIKEPTKITPQDDSKATYTEHLTRQSGYIDFSNELEIENWKLKIERAVRAYHPWPGVWFKTKVGGQNRVVKLLPDQKIQVEGKKPMSYKDFMNGYSEGRKILEQLGQLDN